MVEALTDLPPGALGFRLAGRLRRADYTDVLLPTLRALVERGERLRLLVVIDPSFDGLEAGALMQELKADLDLGLRHRSAWERIAVASDAEWVRRSVAVLGWIVPGEIRVFALGELEPAKAWVAGA
jgi:SpoIIAA-like